MSRTFVACLVIVLGAVVGACGSPPVPTLDPGPPPTSTAAAQAPPPTASADPLLPVLQAAVAATIDAGSARIERTVDYRGNSQIRDGEYISSSGRITFGHPWQMVGAADFSGPGFGELQLLLQDDLVVVSGAFFDEAIGPGKWLVVDLASSDVRAARFRFLAAEHQHALVLLYGLHGATDIRDLGEEPFHGLVAAHYAMHLDFVAAAEAAPQDIQEAMRGNRANAVAAGWDPISNADVWIDGDGRIRAVQLLEHAGPRAGGGELQVVIRYDGFGEPVDLEFPADNDLVHLEDFAMPSASPA